ncbi:unnamed protein product [Ectocarpus sp. 12 AP-2014]
MAMWGRESACVPGEDLCVTLRILLDNERKKAPGLPVGELRYMHPRER